MDKYLLIIAVSILAIGCGEKESEGSETTDTPEKGERTSEDPELKEAELELKKAELAEAFYGCLSDAFNGAPELTLQCFEDNAEALEYMGPEEADTLYLSVVNILQEYIFNNEPDIDWENDVDQETYKLKPEVLEPIEQMGLTADSEEGMFFYSINHRVLYKWFDGRVSKPMQTYIDYMDVNPEKIAYDAGLIVEPMILAERIVLMENILAQGDFLFWEELVQPFGFELMWLLEGLDNTPAFDFETGELTDEFNDAIAYVSDYGGSVAADIAEEWLISVSGASMKRPQTSAWDAFPQEGIRAALEEAYR